MTNAASCLAACAIRAGSPPPSDAGSSAPLGSARVESGLRRKLAVVRSTMEFQPAVCSGGERQRAVGVAVLLQLRGDLGVDRGLLRRRRATRNWRALRARMASVIQCSASAV